MRAVVFSIVFVLLFTSFCYASEVIQLWDGSKISAEVISVAKNGVLVNYKGEEIRLKWDTMIPDEALRVWEAHLDKNSAESWFEIGEFALANGRKSGARKYFAKAVELDPSYSTKVPSLDDPEEDRKGIIELLAKANKAEKSKKFKLAISYYKQVLNWSNKKILNEVLMDTDFLNPAMLQDHLKRLSELMLASLGLSRMGLRWVTQKERTIREMDLRERDTSESADAASNKSHSQWENSYSRNGRWFSLRTNAKKWYFKRFVKRLDLLYDEYIEVFGFRKIIESKMAVNIYCSSSDYRNHARDIKPGTSELGGFYADKSIHLFIEGSSDDLTYEDLSVLSLNYLASVLYLHAICKKTPAWLETGIGQYFQDSDWSSVRKISVGDDPNRYSARGFIDGLNSGQSFYSQKLFTSTGNLTEFEHYSSWALVAYCLDGGSSSMKSLFLKCLKQADEVDDPFKPLLQKANQLNSDVPEYIKSLSTRPNIFEIHPYRMF